MAEHAAQSRWHGRGAFLTTSLLTLGLLGGPFLVTRGLVAHGAWFLVALLALMLLVGAPLIRLALATGQLDHRLSRREALVPLAALVRLALAGVILFVGARAGSWIFHETVFGTPAGVPEYQARELGMASASWHGAPGQSLWLGAGAVAGFALLLMLATRRRGIAGLGWIGTPLLPAVAVILVLGLLAGFAIPGAGALAAIVATPRPDAVLRAAFWADAGQVALLAMGAQAGILSAAGRGLPQRASIGREARILSACVALALVVSGLAGLVVLCALCVRQGVVPGAEHAHVTLMLLEVVPALGRDLFSGWPDAVAPTSRQVTLAWQFAVCLCAAFGVAALIASRRQLPGLRSARAAWGYAGVVLVLTGTAVDAMRGVPDAGLPLITVLPALIGLLHLTLARRAGPGMRLSAAAWGSGRAWLERTNLMIAFRVARPILLALVIAMALALREHSYSLGALALAFALVWLGSLPRRPRAPTGVLRAAGLLVLAPMLHASVFTDPTPDAAAWFAKADAARVLDQPAVILLSPRETWRAEVLQRLENAPEETAAQTAARRDQARVALSILLTLEPEDAEWQRMERMLLALDGVRAVRLDEALSEHAAGNPAPLRAHATEIARNLPAPRLRAMLERPEAPTHEWMLALTDDLRTAYGTAPPLTRELRRHLLRRVVAGRSFLRPQPGTGLVLLLCLGLAALTLALALTLGLAPRRAAA